jgi:hypothetical protein
VTKEVLLGARTASIEETATAIAARLGISFHKRDSHFYGDYFLAEIDRGEISVVSQPDPEGEPLEEGFEDYRTLVYIETDAECPELHQLPVVDEHLERLRQG